MNELSPAAQHILKDLPTSPHLQLVNRAYAAAVIRSAAQAVLADPSRPETWLPYRRLMELADELEGVEHA